MGCQPNTCVISIGFIGMHVIKRKYLYFIIDDSKARAVHLKKIRMTLKSPKAYFHCAPTGGWGLLKVRGQEGRPNMAGMSQHKHHPKTIIHLYTIITVPSCHSLISVHQYRTITCYYILPKCKVEPKQSIFV